MITDNKLKIMHLHLVVALARESKKSMKAFFDGKQAILFGSSKVSLQSARAQKRFSRKTKLKKILFMIKKD